jgi:hypothetical protein
MSARSLSARSRAALSLILVAVFCTSCHGWYTFDIQNDTDELYYVRVTVNRTGAVYVHQVDPRASGTAAYGIPPTAPDEGEPFTVELLDADCNPVAEWEMPEIGGYLEISGAPEFVPGGWIPVESASTEGTGDAVASLPADELQHETVLACGATDTFS